MNYLNNRNYSKMSEFTQKWVDVLVPFSSYYSAKLSASQLSKKTKIPQQTISRLMNKLVLLNLVNYEKIGKNKLFYFDLKSQKSRILLNIIENQKAMRFQLEAEDAAIIINEILNHCESLIVFGSYASGKNKKDSDLDIVILGKNNKEKIKKIKQKQIIEVNEHYISYSGFLQKLKSKNPLAIEIMKNHVLFGDVSKIVDILLRAKK